MKATTHLYCIRCAPHAAGAPAELCVRCEKFVAQGDAHYATLAAEAARKEAAERKAEQERLDREYPYQVHAVTMAGQGMQFVGRYRTMEAAREAAAGLGDGRPWLRGQDVRIETPAGRRICFAGPAR